MHKRILEITKSVSFFRILPQENLHKCLQHKCNGIPSMSYTPILCVRKDARTDSDVNTRRRSAGMRTCLKGQAFDCVRLQTLNCTFFFSVLMLAQHENVHFAYFGEVERRNEQTAPSYGLLLLLTVFSAGTFPVQKFVCTVINFRCLYSVFTKEVLCLVYGNSN
jgi:hypothetical protein